MNYKSASKVLKAIGCSKASDSALCAMYADLLVTIHGGKPDAYYDYLDQQTKTDAELRTKFKELSANRVKAWDVLIGVV